MLQPIRAILFDIDGVLTEGGIKLDNAGNELKTFNVRDGMLISRMLKMGFYFGAITGRESQAVYRRMKELEVAFLKQDCHDKGGALKEFSETYDIPLSAIAYIGDDLNDIPAFKNAAVATCPADAPLEVKQQCDLVLQTRGGKGVLRELCERILRAQEKWDDVVESFGGSV